MIFPNTALIDCFQIRLGRMTTATSSGGIQTVTDQLSPYSSKQVVRLSII